MAQPAREVLFPAYDDVVVAALWYGEPHNVWRIEIRQPDDDMSNLDAEQAGALGNALLEACRPWNYPANFVR